MKRGKGRGIARLGTMLCALALALAAGPGTATGDGGAKTQIRLTKIGKAGAKGVVNSSRQSCVAGRKVRFFKLENYVSVKVQFTKTDAQGDWRIKRDLSRGRYFAKVDGSPGCRYDVSRNKSVE